MLEVLVVMACLQGPGCSDTWAEYYRRNELLQQSARTAEARVKANVNEKVLTLTTTAAILYTRQDANIIITRNLRLQYSPGRDTTTVLYTLSY